MRRDRRRYSGSENEKNEPLESTKYESTPPRRIERTYERRNIVTRDQVMEVVIFSALEPKRV